MKHYKIVNIKKFIRFQRIVGILLLPISIFLAIWSGIGEGLILMTPLSLILIFSKDVVLDI